MIKLQESGEMYLETILVLTGKSKIVRAVDIAEYMNFSKPSVSRALSILKDEGYIYVSNNGHITLSEKGETIAVKIYERHIVLSNMLQSLGVSVENAEKDACKMEHDISEETFAAFKNLYSLLLNKKIKLD